MSNTVIYKKGSNSPYVAKIQRALNETLGLNLKTDGDFGSVTEKALMSWQNKNKFPQTGIFQDSTAAVLGAYIDRRFLDDNDFQKAAQVLDVELACVKAVQEVESKGSGFMNDGRLIILFERHIFRKELNKAMLADPQLVSQLIVKLSLNPQPGQQLIPLIQDHLTKTQSDIYNQTPGGYLGGSREWERLQRAAIFDSTCAHKAASWGLYQIMGYHHTGLGFGTVHEMVKSYALSEKNQLSSFCDFIKGPTDPRLLRALKTKSWLSFAKAYNGPAQNGYDVKLTAAYNLHKKTLG